MWLARLTRMYDVDDRDRVAAVSGVSECDIGAPLPVVLADESRVLLGYLLGVDDPDWDGTYVRTVGLERMNSVHPHNRPERFWQLSHFVFAFHDSTFECVAESFTADTVSGPMTAIAGEMHRRLFSRS